MKNFTRWNNIIGWGIGIAASVIYMLTAEPSASYWDCGEFISCAYKFEVGHPPGAPTFLLLGRIVSLLTGGDVTLVALFINYLSAISSGLAVMFTFWVMTYFIRRILIKSDEDLTLGNMLAMLGAGIVGAFAFAFCDSYWFSAVEAEVYGMAGFFTTLILWLATKWEREKTESGEFRYLILIIFLIGFSIGVHLLNLLAIPAIGYIYYFKKYSNPNWKGIVVTTIVSMGITGMLLSVIIPQIISIFASTELLFVNTFGFPFNSGTLFLVLILVSFIIAGIFYTHQESPSQRMKIILIGLSSIFILLIFVGSSSLTSFFMRLIFTGVIVYCFYRFCPKKRALFNTLFLCFAYLLIGYSTYLILVIRANADTPLNENAPKDALSLLSYMNREQYGDWPLFYGPYYNAPTNPTKEWKDGTPVYARDNKKGKYIVIDDRKNSIPTYNPDFCTIFPRMWSSDESLDHPSQYKSWANVKGKRVSYEDPSTGEMKTDTVPTFFDNVKFFLNYQVGHMYLRYFMWNFVGRQNDIQNTDGNAVEGNWYSGIPFIDERLGPQSDIPENLKHNKGTNKFYFLPLILGFLGFYYHLSKKGNDSLIVIVFFLMTGLAIILYLNQYPNQPRERDYAYAGSFMAFCIWIAMGVIAIYDYIRKKIKPSYAAVGISLLCFLAVPYVMGKEGWDDHDRSKRYTMIDFATDYLNSCAPNAILFTNGDNDTFPLWYAQEVEGIRTDVRVCNLSLLSTDWYINSMKKKAYDSDPIPFGLTWDKYHEGSLEYVYFIPSAQIKGYIDLKKLMDFIASDDPNTKFQSQYGDVEYFPTKNFRIPVDSATVVNTGTVSKDEADSIVSSIDWTLNRYGVQKNSLMILDLLANNNWKRPVYFASTSGPSTYLGLNNYLQQEGLAYRLVPVKRKNNSGEIGTVNTAIMYNNMMNKFKWGNINDTNIYVDETVLGMAMSLRSCFADLANALSAEGKKDSAIAVLDKCQQVFPERNVPYNHYEYLIGEAYYKAGDTTKANAILKHMIDIYEADLKYYFSFKGSKAITVDYHKRLSLQIMHQIALTTLEFKQEELSTRSGEIFEKYYNLYIPSEN